VIPLGFRIYWWLKLGQIKWRTIGWLSSSWLVDVGGHSGKWHLYYISAGNADVVNAFISILRREPLKAIVLN